MIASTIAFDGSAPMPTASEVIFDKLNELRQGVARVEQQQAERGQRLHQHNLERALREQRDWERQDEAQRARADVASKAHSAGCAASQAALQPYFSKYGEAPPPPIAGSNAIVNHLHLLSLLQSKISSKDARTVRSDNGSPYEVGALSASELPLDQMPMEVVRRMETPLLKAVSLQADFPHRSTLPKDGSMLMREREMGDESGRKERVYFGRKSFIHGFSRPGRIVSSLLGRNGERVSPSTGEPMLPR
jgi:hypothetical protein